MCPILVVVTDILSKQPFQMPLVQDDDMIQQVSAAAANPSLGNAVLPRTRKAVRTGSLPMPFANDTTSFAEFRIAVEEQEAVCRRVRTRFAHLLHDP